MDGPWPRTVPVSYVGVLISSSRSRLLWMEYLITLKDLLQLKVRVHLNGLVLQITIYAHIKKQECGNSKLTKVN